MKTTKQLEEERIELIKKSHLKTRKSYTRREEKRADSNNYYFDKVKFCIIKKGQLSLI